MTSRRSCSGAPRKVREERKQLTSRRVPDELRFVPEPAWKQTFSVFAGEQVESPRLRNCLMSSTTAFYHRRLP